jgi:hypothetical protein
MPGRPSQSSQILPATPSPFSPQKFFEPLPPPGKGAVLPDDSDNWWAGVQNCFASIAVAAALLVGAQTAQAIATVNLPQDDPAGNLTVCPNEDYWTGRTQTIYLPPVQAFTDNDVISVFVEELYWQVPVVQPVPAVLQAFADDSLIVPQAVVFSPDEDYCWLLLQPGVSQLPPIGAFNYDDVIPPQPVVGVQNYVSPGTHNYVSQDVGSGIEF